MSGNVEEWCLNERDRPQHTELSGTARREVRGGSWSSSWVFACASSRSGLLPGARLSFLGLRVVRASPSPA